MEIFTMEFGILALIGGLLSSLMTSLSGTVMVLRRMSFFGSGIAHLSFLGVGVAISAGLPVTPTVLAVAVASALVLGYLSRRGIHEDVGIGIVFSTSMALGIVLVYLSGVDSSRMMAYLFGDILAIDRTDISILSIVSAVVIVYMVIFRDHLVYMTFDEDFSKVLGIKIDAIYYSFLVLLAVSIVLSMKMMGIILVTAMVVIPPASALLLSRTYKGAFKLAPVISSISVFLGILTSYSFDLPTGATIVLIQGLIFLSAFLIKILGS